MTPAMISGTRATRGEISGRGINISGVIIFNFCKGLRKCLILELF